MRESHTTTFGEGEEYAFGQLRARDGQPSIARMTHEVSRANYRAIFEQSPAGIVIYGRDLRVVDCNESFTRMIHSSRERLVGLHIDELRDQRHRSALLRALDGKIATYESPYQATTSDAWPLLSATFGPLRNSEGVVTEVIVMVDERCTRLNADRPSSTRALWDAERFGRIGSWTWDEERRMAAASTEFSRILGLDPHEALSLTNCESLIHPEDREEYRVQLAAMLERRARSVTHELRIVRPDQSTSWIALQAEAAFAADGRLLAIGGLIQDVTDRRQLEEQVRQAQKMEVMGQLAAGVAHDFNNLLTVINLETEALGGVEASLDTREAVRGIRAAAARAGGLTSQLLAFSRKKLLRLQILDVNDTVAGATQMLRRLLGADVELLTALIPKLPPILADHGQLEQVLVNLAVNARDAMPCGGRLSITTGVEVLTVEQPQLPRGDYVVIEVSDTGHGMDVATRRRIFEPFFTTKGPGHGTGLGLSTVYGIMEQSAGHITVTSEPGQGSTFKLYFVAQGGEVECAGESPRAAGTRQVQPASAIILLVEDEPAVRNLCQRLLKGAGYTVLIAEDGYDALGVAEIYPQRIDLLLTDIVLPTLNGRELYNRLQLKRPDLRVLYMSGYSYDEVVRRGLVDAGARALEKPFAAADLVKAVREALDPS